MNDYDETKEAYMLSILISTINTEGLYQNHFLTGNLNMLNIYQCINYQKTTILAMY